MLTQRARPLRGDPKFHVEKRVNATTDGGAPLVKILPSSEMCFCTQKPLVKGAILAPVESPLHPFGCFFARLRIIHNRRLFMARPRKGKAERHSHQIVFRLTAAEFERVQAKAERAGLGANELARRMVRRGGGRVVIETSRRTDPAILKRLERIGLNLNQLTKNAHIFKRVSPRVEFLCQEIQELMSQTLEERMRE